MHRILWYFLVTLMDMIIIWKIIQDTKDFYKEESHDQFTLEKSLLVLSITGIWMDQQKWLGKLEIKFFLSV